MFANLEELEEFEYQLYKLIHDNKRLLPDDDGFFNMCLMLAKANEMFLLRGMKVADYNYVISKLSEFGIDVSSLANVTNGRPACQTRAGEQRNAPAEAGGAVCTCAEFVQSVFDQKRCAVCRKPRLGG